MEIPKFDAAAFAADFNKEAAVNVAEIRNVGETRQYPFAGWQLIDVTEFDATFDIPHKVGRYMAIGSDVVASSLVWNTTKDGFEDIADAIARIRGACRGGYTFISPRVVFAPPQSADYKSRTYFEHASAVINPGEAYPETHIGSKFLICQDSIAIVGSVGNGVIIADNSKVSAARIGSGTQIGYSTSVGVSAPETGQVQGDTPFQMQPFSTTKIGDYAEIGDQMHIGNEVTIGDRVYVGGTNVADNAVIKQASMRRIF